MAIKLFPQRNLQGKYTIIKNDKQRFTGPYLALGASKSMELTSDNDRIILFKNNNWDGEAMFRSGKQVINDLGNESGKGKAGFDKGFRSLRITNFKIRMKYHIIMKSDGTLPGNEPSKQSIEMKIGKLHIMASNIWKQGLISWVNDGCIYEEDNDLFEARCGDLIANPNYYIAQSHCYPFIVDKLNKLGCAGPRWKVSGFLSQLRKDNNLNLNARTWAHELGHQLGLGHGSNSIKNRLMTQTGSAAPIYGTELSDVELEKVHKGLSDTSAMAALYRQE